MKDFPPKFWFVGLANFTLKEQFHLLVLYSFNTFHWSDNRPIFERSHSTSYIKIWLRGFFMRNRMFIYLDHNNFVRVYLFMQTICFFVTQNLDHTFEWNEIKSWDADEEGMCFWYEYHKPGKKPKQVKVFSKYVCFDFRILIF